MKVKLLSLCVVVFMVASLTLAACTPPEPEIVEVTRVVEREKEVVVTQIVEVEGEEVIVEVTKVVKEEVEVMRSALIESGMEVVREAEELELADM